MNRYVQKSSLVLRKLEAADLRIDIYNVHLESKQMSVTDESNVEMKRIQLKEIHKLIKRSQSRFTIAMSIKIPVLVVGDFNLGSNEMIPQGLSDLLLAQQLQEGTKVTMFFAKS